MTVLGSTSAGGAGVKARAELDRVAAVGLEAGTRRVGSGPTARFVAQA